ncbi:hypothetical protein B296_00044844 [Ensete ventricosum]|uniref:Aconitase/3-isopropylmalate dehydratase large subunit alpha/beta/alpha domain-containing protein n=1 Tax=Ensete ventricosum TaxID=4639 RepID=A0A426Z9H0_ENSVE|nr:hypothetical protein B296_00044844 [Ensete ventricosum]
MASCSSIFGAKVRSFSTVPISYPEKKCLIGLVLGLQNKSSFASCFSPSIRAHSFRKHALNKVLAVMAPARSPRSPSSTGSVGNRCVLFVQVKHAMTMTEKILARASEKSHLEPGENIWVNVDVLMTHDVCGPGTIGIFKKEFGQNARVTILILIPMVVLKLWFRSLRPLLDPI